MNAFLAWICLVNLQQVLTLSRKKQHFANFTTDK